MYERTIWLDEVDQYEDRYRETANSDGSVTHTRQTGEVYQSGTPVDAAHLNNLELGVSDAVLAALILTGALRQSRLTLERGSVTLQNTLGYPFSDAAQTVALRQERNTNAYTVIARVVSADGNVENVEAEDLLANGFKLKYSGSAKRATIEYAVIGGELQ